MYTHSYEHFDLPSYSWFLEDVTPHKKWSFPLTIFSENVTKSAVSWVFGPIYWRNIARLID